MGSLLLLSGIRTKPFELEFCAFILEGSGFLGGRVGYSTRPRSSAGADSTGY